MRALWLVLLVAACDKPEETDTGDTDTDTDSDSDTDTGSDTDTDTDTEDTSASLTDAVLDQDGAPFAGVRVQVCRDQCRAVVTGADGAFSFPTLEADWQSFEVYPPATDPFLVPMVPLLFGHAEARELDATWVAPTHTAAFPAAAAELELADGLFVTAGQDNAELPFGVESDDLFGGLVPEEAWLPVEGDAAGEVVAMWNLGPFDTAASGADLPLRLEGLDLDEGLSVELFVSVYEVAGPEIGWASCGAGVVSGGAVDGLAVPHLGTLVLVATGR